MLILISQIMMMCMYQIDPSYDKNDCIDYMLQCTYVNKMNFDSCSDFWEPSNFNPNNNNDYYGDPGEADYSYR